MAGESSSVRSLVGFSKISDDMMLYEPISSSLEPPTVGGPVSLVTLCTWVAASPRHIAKYTDVYRSLFPTASILVLQSSLADMVYRTDGAQQTRLARARDVILSRATTEGQQRSANAHEAGGNDKGSVLLHAFSNGGAQCAGQLAVALPPQQRQCVFRGLVLDSCPGRGTYMRSANAIILSLPKASVARVIGTIIVHLVLVVLFFFDRVAGFENVITCARRRLNSQVLFDRAAPRLYLYSKADEMVWYEDVQEHAAQARENGYESVNEVSFEGSGHCAHATIDGEKYWDAVRSLVEGRQTILSPRMSIEQQSECSNV